MPAASDFKSFNDSRTWRPTPEGGPLAPQILQLTSSDEARLAFDLSEVLNPGTLIATVDEVVEDGTSHNPTIASIVTSENKSEAQFQLSSLSTGVEIRIRVTVTSTDGNVLSFLGWVHT